MKRIFVFDDEPLSISDRAALETAGYTVVGLTRTVDSSGQSALPDAPQYAIGSGTYPVPREAPRAPVPAGRVRPARDSEQDRRFLLRLGETMHAATDSSEILGQVSSELGQYLAASRCHFLQVDAANDLVTLHRGYRAGVPQLPEQLALSAFGATTASAAARGETFVLEDAQSDRRTAAVFEASYAPVATCAVVSVPLMRDRTWVAGLVVASSTPRAWREREIALVRLVAERTWLWLEHLRMRADLERAHARFETFVDDVKEYAIFLLDAAGNVATWNAGAERVMGYRGDEIIGQPQSVFYLPGDAPRAQAVLDSAVRAGRYEEEGWRIRKDGTRFWASVAITPAFDRERAVESYAVVTRDYTDRRRHEDELRLQQAILTQNRKEREALTQEVDHRVKNNLQVIASLINMQLRKLAPGDARDALLQTRTRVLAIAFAQQQLHRAKDYTQLRFDAYLRDLIEHVRQAIGVALDRVAVELAIDDVPLGIDRAIPCALVINELMLHALEHGFAGGRRGAIQIELRALDGGLIRLAVRHDGAGLPLEFDVQRADSMGLQLVCTLAEQLDAALAVTGAGTGFELTFAAIER
ncbi:MAG TPA: histidine kinase dimerization/phosphoacceptor domain -containing protein [Kofleriaceae bacterium]